MDYPYFCGGSYTAQSPITDQERTVNLYVERTEVPSSASQFSMFGTPGVKSLVTAPTSPGRAHFYDTNSKREFAVVGNVFYEISAAGDVITNRGAVAIDGNPATISSNGDGGGELLVTSGGNAYLFTLATNVFTQIAALNGLATMGAHVDGYFLVLNRTTSTVRFSGIYDGATWDPTNFFQRSAAPDKWASLNVANRLIYLLGEQTSEVWYNAGISPVPFTLHPSSGVLPYGIAAAFSAAIVESSLVWLSNTVSGRGPVVKVAGFQVEPISTFAVQVAISRMAVVSDAIGDSYTDLGHTFYVLTFPTANATWCWDANSGPNPWHERMTWDKDTATELAWRPLWHAAVANGEHRTLDRATGTVYQLSSDLFYDVDGREIRRIRQAPVLALEDRRLYFPGFQLLVEVGIGVQGNAGDPGVDPQIALQSSDDGGRTWGNERWRSVGKAGQFGIRVQWNRCGSAFRRVFRITMSDPVKWRIIGAVLPGLELPRAS